MGRLVIIIVAGAFLVLGTYVYFGQATDGQSVNGSSARQFAIPVELAVVETAPFVERETAVGSLASNEAVIIRSEIAGRIAKIGFDEGQDVLKGDLLISIDDSIYRAEFNQADARLNLSRANYERAVDLERRGAGTQRALDEAFSKLREDQATLDLASARLERTEIRAPFSGVIGIRKVSPGDYITAGQEIVNLESIDPIKVAFQVPEVLLQAVRAGQSVMVSVDAYPGERFAGEVYAIDPRIESTGRSINLRAKVSNPDGRLRPGLFARIDIIFERRVGAMMIPERALVPIQAQQNVFIIDDNIAYLRVVTTGGRVNGRVEILTGVEPGDIIVTEGQLKLRDGTPVVDASQLMGPDV